MRPLRAAVGYRPRATDGSGNGHDGLLRAAIHAGSRAGRGAVSRAAVAHAGNADAAKSSAEINARTIPPLGTSGPQRGI